MSLRKSNLTLAKIAATNRDLLSFPGTSSSSLPKKPKGFLEQKEEEKKLRLEQQIEVAEREKYLSNLLGEASRTEAPEMLLIDPVAQEVRRVEAGKPVIVQMPAPAQQPAVTVDIGAAFNTLLNNALEAKKAPVSESKSYLVNPSAPTPEQAVQEIGARPVIIYHQQAPVSIPVSVSSNPLSSLKDALVALAEQDELRTAFRKLLGVPESQSGPGTTPVYVSMKDAQGNPMQLDIDNFMKLQSFVNEQKRKEGLHSELTNVLASVRDNIPKFASALQKFAGKKEEQPRYHEAPCEHCGEKLMIPQGAQKVVCPKCSFDNEIKWA